MKEVLYKKYKDEESGKVKSGGKNAGDDQIKLRRESLKEVYISSLACIDSTCPCCLYSSVGPMGLFYLLCQDSLSNKYGYTYSYKLLKFGCLTC